MCGFKGKRIAQVTKATSGDYVCVSEVKFLI